MKRKKKKSINLIAGPCCRCNSKKENILYKDLPEALKKVFKKNDPKEVSHYSYCHECGNYTAMPRDGEFWF